MKTTLRLLSLAGLLLFASLLEAQPGPPEPQAIRPTLRKMTTAQKMELLDFLRNNGADLDREIQQAYEQLSLEKRAQAAQYMDLLNKGIDNIPRTTVAWSHDTLHYGQIEEGDILLDSFRVINTGVYPYVVKDVKTSCDCTVLQFPRFLVMPGQSATLRVEFDSRGKQGRTTPAIVVHDNSSPNTRNILYLDGAIVPRVKKKSIIDD